MFNPFAKLPSVNPEEVARRIQEEKNVAFIDVRSSMEYDDGHARGARNIPLNTLLEHTDELTKYDEVYVICQSGGRSSQAVQHLLANDVHAINVTGGTNAWQATGLPIE
jgi:rhodanese-related sulfurtransferase